MAGDLRIHEQCLILGRVTAAESALSAAVEQVSGGVMHQYGQRVIIAAAPPAANEFLGQQAPAATLMEEPADLSEAMRGELDAEEALGVAAFSLRQSMSYKSGKAQRPLAEETWDSGKALQPDAFHDEAYHAAEAAFAGAAAPTSARLTGKVAVGLIIVEGPTPDLRFSDAERTKVVAEVQNGLTWLGSQSSPTGVSWFYDIKVITLNVPPGPASETFEQKEDRWRNPAMAQLGYGPGLGGVQDYIENLRTAKGTDWAYCAFFTKYPIGWFAYASIGGPRLVMDYNNDGWGPDNIDRVFAHETGHIFNAPDEYASSGCTCGGQWGAFNVPNSNCENCAPGGGVPCIMKGNTWEMCPYTPFHLGFPQGQRYSGVYQAASGSHGLWVNADWQHFVAKWQEWSDQGLRLDDIEISQPGGQLRYSGVFRQGSGGYGLWVLASWNSFVAKWQEWSGQGLRLIDLEITPVGNELRYTGVFRQGSGGYGLWVNADWNSFVAKWQEWNGQGLRLVDLTVTQVGNQLRYSGVFVQGSGGYGLWALADWNSFVAKWQEWSGQGLRLVDLEITRVGNDTRYSGVFRQGSGGYTLWVNADWSSFVTRWNEWSSQGLRLVDFDVTLTGIEAAASMTGADAARAAGEAVGAAGYGYLAMADAVGGDEMSGEGFGAVSLPALQPESPSGAGYGVSSPHAQEEGSAGFGRAFLPGAPAAGQETGGTGLNLAALLSPRTTGQERSGAGFGVMSGGGAKTDGGGDPSSAGYGEIPT